MWYSVYYVVIENGFQELKAGRKIRCVANAKTAASRLARLFVTSNKILYKP